MAAAAAPVLVVGFYEANKGERHGAFCNYHLAPQVMADGKSYASVEHFYQSRKIDASQSADHAAFAEVIRAASTPNKAKILATMSVSDGRGYAWRTALDPIIADYLARGVRIRPEWKAIKEEVMLEGLRAKFTQHPALATLLLSTGDASIVEQSPRDSYWGWGADKQGKNRLGHLLVQVRTELRQTPAPATTAATGIASFFLPPRV
jgi:ribA/ribD-fused uncharacterized protein